VRLRTHRTRTRFAAVGTAVATLLATLASLAGVIGTSVAPAAAGTNGQTTYEVDCVGTSLAAGQTAPFIQGLNVNTVQAGLPLPDPQPAGTSFGVSGTASETLIGPIIAGAYQQINLALTGGLTAAVNETVGSTDGSATGSFNYVHNFGNQAAPGHQIASPANGGPGVSWTAGSPVLTSVAGAFLQSDVGTPTNPMFVAGPSLNMLPTIDPNSTVVSVAADGSSATISLPTLQSQSLAQIGLGQSLTYADLAFSTGDVFTSSGAAHSNVGLASMSSTTLSTAFGGIIVPFGGAPGTTTAADPAPRCLLTGYDAAGNPGPSQFGDTTPADPVITHPQYVAAGITPLVLATGGFITQPNTAQAITPPAAAFVAGEVCTAPAPTITTTSVPNGVVGSAYSATLQATDGVLPLSWSVSAGTLPAGLTLNASTGEISGTPTTGGTSSFTVTVTDSCVSPGPQTDTQALSIFVDAPPVAANQTATIDRNVSNTTTVTLPATDSDATPVASCSQVGSVSDPRLTVSISNAPTPCVATLTDTAGASAGAATVTFQFNATDTANLTGNTATVTVTIVPVPHVAIATTSLPNADEGVPYSQTLAATGGTPPYTWSVTGLPTGLNVDPATGAIMGTPGPGTGNADYPLAVTVTDSDSPAETATASLTLHVNPPPQNDGALDVIVNGPVSSTKTSKALVGKVTNTGQTTFQVCNTDFTWVVTVNGTTTGSVTMPSACATLGPGASKRFKATWTYPAGSVATGDTVVFTGSVNVAGDPTPADNTNITETRIAK
jgi:Putative Ig domain